MGKSLTEWYYPGGYVQDSGNYPRDDEDELGWDLLYLFNPDASEPVHVDIRLYFEDAAPQAFERTVQPWEKLRTPMHRRPWRDYVGVNRPFGMRLAGDRAVFPHITRAEYESWDEHNPTAMYGLLPYQGPLGGERCWWYAEGFWQDSPAHPWVEEEWIHVLNPGDRDGAFAITFYLADGQRVHEGRIGAERLAVVRVGSLGLVPSGAHYGVRVACDEPVIVQQTRRTFEKGGTPATRSITGTLAVPFGSG